MILKGPCFLKTKEKEERKLIQENVKVENSKGQEKQKTNQRMKETLNWKFRDMQKSGEIKNIKETSTEIEEIT